MNDRLSCAVAVAVRRPGGDSVLGVLRPDDPNDPLAGVWGLPASSVASLLSPEALEEAVRDMARRKLGMALTAVQEIGSRREERPDGTFSMTLFEAQSADVPALPDPASIDSGATFYANWRWMRTQEFLPAADRGSLCTRLLLDASPSLTGGPPS